MIFCKIAGIMECREIIGNYLRPVIAVNRGENIKLSSISVFNGVNLDLVTVKEIENR